MENSSQWYCVRTQMKREHIAAQHLAQRVGIEVFAPRIALRHPRRSGQAFITLEALFPSYIFARFSLRENARHVASTQGIKGLVRFGERVPAIAPQVVEFLRSQVASAPNVTDPILQIGDWIEVLAGSLCGQEGRVVEIEKASDRIAVLLSLLGREITIEFSAADVRPAGDFLRDFPPQLLAATAG